MLQDCSSTPHLYPLDANHPHPRAVNFVPLSGALCPALLSDVILVVSVWVVLDEMTFIIFPIIYYFIYIYLKFIHLLVPGLSCSTWDL